MARRLRFLADVDHPVRDPAAPEGAAPRAYVAYRAGWDGLVPDATVAALPEGTFEDLGGVFDEPEAGHESENGAPEPSDGA